MKPLRFLFPRCILYVIMGAGLAVTGYAATYTVINTDDSGAGSLRQAIEDANTNEGPDTIEFNIPGDGPHTIAPLTDLPEITEPVVIDGYTQPGAMANTLSNAINAVLKIELDGGNLEGTGVGLVVATSDSTVRGLAIHSFPSVCLTLGKWLTFGLSGNVLEGCFIGTDITGTTDPSEIGGGGVVTYSNENVIGGTSPAARNLISGNTYAGITLSSSLSVVQGNFIGTDVTGSKALPNGTGFSIFSASQNLIGGTEAGAANVISGNSGDGIGITAAAGGDNEIKGNFIGTDITGTIPLGNGVFGISVLDASYNVIGDDGPNVIAHNRFGIRINGAAAFGNEILNNSIHSNTDAGIQLGYGSTNDECDEDYGPNDTQNHPVLLTAVSSCETTITGSLESIPEVEYRIQFFSNPECHSSGSGEGKVFLGETSVALGEACVKEFSATLPVGLRTGWVVTATATDPEGNTSQFSACVDAEVEVDFWAEEVDLGGGWNWVDWFGTYNTSASPWLNHQEHGFIYRIQPDACNLFLYEEIMQSWWWTVPDVYPYVYRFSDGAWLYYLPDSNNPRWFYNYKVGGWEEW